MAPLPPHPASETRELEDFPETPVKWWHEYAKERNHTCGIPPVEQQPFSGLDVPLTLRHAPSCLKPSRVDRLGVAIEGSNEGMLAMAVRESGQWR